MVLFRRKYKKKITRVWGVISVLVIISMVILYAGFASTMFMGSQNEVDNTNVENVEILEEDILEVEVDETIDTEAEL